MNASEFKAAFAIADNPAIDLSGEDTSILDGFALRDFGPVTVTLRQVAAVMRWQALYIMTKPGASKWDSEALTEIRECFRKRVTVAG